MNESNLDEEGLEIPQIDVMALTRRLVDEGHLGPEAINIVKGLSNG